MNPRRLLLLTIPLVTVGLFGRRLCDHCVVPDYHTVDLAAMGSFNLDPFNAKLEDIPEQFRALDGQRIKVTGEVSPFGYSELPTTFRLARGPFINHHEPPKAQSFIVASVRTGRSITVSSDGGEITVSGTLHLSLRQDEGQTIHVYTMDVDRLVPREVPLPMPALWELTALYAGTGWPPCPSAWSQARHIERVVGSASARRAVTTFVLHRNGAPNVERLCRRGGRVAYRKGDTGPP